MATKKLKYWFDEELAKMLADKIIRIDKSFDSDGFIQNVSEKVSNQELKDRVESIADELYDFTRKDFEQGIYILKQILGPENENETGMFSKYYWIMPIAKYVEKYGL